MHQANELGGHIRKGEKSTWSRSSVLSFESSAFQKATIEAADEKTRRRFLLIYYRVLNPEPCELPQRVLDKLPRIEMQELDPIDEGERIIAAMPNPPEIQARRFKCVLQSSRRSDHPATARTFHQRRGILRHGSG
jgi:antirestriction protein ArdC